MFQAISTLRLFSLPATLSYPFNSWQIELQPVLEVPLLPYNTMFLHFFASEAAVNAQALEMALR
jgi:hypothetical protein